MEDIEEWLPVVGYEGIYEISSYGALKVLARTWRSGRKGSQVKHRDEFIMKPKQGKDKYIYYELFKDGIGNKYKAHRLEGIAHIPNPLNLPCINHKNGIRWDNRKSNLEWSTQAYNVQHGFDVLGRKPTWLGTGRGSRERAILQMDSAGNIIFEFYNSNLAAKSVGCSGTSIRQAANKNRPSMGYWWKFKDTILAETFESSL